MSRHCKRPGCSKVGEIIYEVDLRRLLVTIDFPDLNDLTPINLLCRRHADSLTVPKGWIIINNREEVQRLFSAPVTQQLIKNSSQKVIKSQKVSDFNESKKDQMVMANLFDLVIDEHEFETMNREGADSVVEIGVEIRVESRAESAVDLTAELAQLMDAHETEAMPWTPQFDRSGDLNGKLRARGRLLGRAFGHSDIDGRDPNHDYSHDHDQSHSEF
ncbi:MAG: hypothetical protein NT119_03650 [Actinobacteria bacterium]|nr:hypothetical protein [Actinomycetota bacterium]